MNRRNDSRQYSHACRRNFGDRHHVGFTLLELLVVVAIVIFLGGLVAPNVVSLVRENRVSQAAESVREVISISRTFALDAGFDYQFRYETNGQKFVVLPLDLEPADTGSTGEDTKRSDYMRLSGELDEDFRLHAVDDVDETIEVLEAAWFGQLDNALMLSQAKWSSPIIFRFDGTAADAGFQITTTNQLTVDLSVRGLTGGISVSRIYRESD
ncbi:MAG: prepilin-type N-terminal cleavage/methylation domain-containing protein [Fuerstiella sp.]|nr:prepilin-type N-terminal cleavage/methylation domain-containing protein [Fuerstiella sp.]